MQPMQKAKRQTQSVIFAEKLWELDPKREFKYFCHCNLAWLYQYSRNPRFSIFAALVLVKDPR